MANCSSDASFMNDDFSELMWDNGPVMLQAPWKSSLHTTYTHASRVEERDSKDCTYPHIGHFRPIEPKVNFYTPSGFSAGFGVHALEDDVDPWNYTAEESLRNVYCPENLTDYSGNGSDPSRVIPSQLFQLPQQFTKSRTVESGFGATDNADEDQDQDGEGLKSPSTHFLDTAAVPSNPVESILIESRSCLKSSLENQDRPVLKPISELESGSSPKSPQEVIIIDIPETTGNFTISPDQIQSPSFAWSAVLERRETGKEEEAALASSGSNIKTASNDHNHREKRTRHKGEEFGYQSEESLGLKKHCMSRGKSTRRNRAAEVHNLSERRRRDRINEKMRALQELIPNCNKIDKASMLDDAIEYLKTLQMQVQIMSTGGGFCVHPMVMMQQHIRAATMPHFSPMSAGMGMGMGYGMGMYKVDGSPLCHFVPVAPFHHLPGFSILPILEKPGQRFPMSMAHQAPATSAPCPTTSKDQLQRNTSSEKIQKSSTGGSQNSENFSGTERML